jgi:hypothetical protein
VRQVFTVIGKPQAEALGDGREAPASQVDTVRTTVEAGVNFLDLTVFKPEARDRSAPTGSTSCGSVSSTAPRTTQG